jgi:hypothetical protein
MKSLFELDDVHRAALEFQDREFKFLPEGQKFRSNECIKFTLEISISLKKNLQQLA